MMEKERLRFAIASLLGAADRIARIPEAALCRGLVTAARLLADETSSVGAEMRAALPATSGLSREMIEHCVRSSCAAVDERGVTAILRSGSRNGALTQPARLATVVLAGNVFSASLRALLVPLALRVPVLCKASSRDDVFPRCLARALEIASPELASALHVVTFAGGDADLEAIAFERADVVSFYGSDATIAAARERIPVATRLVPHGHGLGIAYVPAQHGDPNAWARELALDVAAYDQRGCLSPHAVLVDRGAGGRDVAVALHGALEALRRELPRGPLGVAEGSLQLQWRGVAAVRGDLFEGDGFAVSFEGNGSVRLSPGYRNVSVIEIEPGELAARLAPFGAHLKALGVAGSAEDRARIAGSLPRPLAPRVSAFGAMQTPPFDAIADGEHPALGFVRSIELA